MCSKMKMRGRFALRIRKWNVGEDYYCTSICQQGVLGRIIRKSDALMFLTLDDLNF